MRCKLDINDDNEDMHVVENMHWKHALGKIFNSLLIFLHSVEKVFKKRSDIKV